LRDDPSVRWPLPETLGLDGGCRSKLKRAMAECASVLTVLLVEV
jgi:hypothetical protein